jgi:hypothetical protein
MRGSIETTGAFAARNKNESSVNGYETIQAAKVEFKPRPKKQC